MTDVIAIAATIVMCLNGPINKDSKCDDGSSPIHYTLNILNGHTNCAAFKWTNPKRCLSTFDSILKLTINDHLILNLNPNGTTEYDPAYSPDKMAMLIYKAIAEILDQKVLNNIGDNTISK